MNVYVRETSARIADSGTAVDIYTRRSDSLSPAVVEVSPGVRVIHVDDRPHEMERERLPCRLEAFEAGVDAFARAEGVRYQGVVSHYWLSGLAGLELGAAWSVPHAAAFHTLALAKQAAYSLEPADEERVRGEQRVVATADVLLVAGTHERDELVARYAADRGKIRLAAPGVDQARFFPRDRDACRLRLGIRSARKIVLQAGRAIPLKGGEVLLAALASMPVERRPDVWIVGGESGSPEHGRLLQCAKNFGVSDSVHLSGSVEHEKLSVYYGAADVVVAPSYYESFGMAALEAEACGRAVVASRVGGLSAVVAHGLTGLLAAPGDAAAVERALSRLLADPAEAERFGRAGAAAALSRTWEETAASTVGALEEARMIGRPPSSSSELVQAGA